MQIILTSSEECPQKGCRACYYKWRRRWRTRTYNPAILHEIAQRTGEYSFAVGFNDMDPLAEELCRTILESGRELIVTVSADMITRVPPDILENVDTLSISCDASRPIVDADLEYINDLLVRKVVNTVIPRRHKLLVADRMGLLSTARSEWRKCISTKVLSVLDAPDYVYAGMYKGPPDIDWTMSADRIDMYRTGIGYLRGYIRMSEWSGIRSPFPVVQDECLTKILNGRGGKCNGDWMEINGYGEVRRCPYTSTPTTVTHNADEVLELADSYASERPWSVEPLCLQTTPSGSSSEGK